MELARIVINDIGDQQVVFLREIEGSRSFPILIGLFEAGAINRRITEDPPPRPLTHDLLRSTVEQLGGEIEDVVITDLRNHTYFAVLRIRFEGELIEVDSRPSDALAISVHYDPPLPVFVHEDVLAEVG
jgi:bifunctional DNase/RNase